MATVAHGLFDPGGNPTLSIYVAGNGNQPGLELVAIIDTGFTGFVLMPSQYAVSLSLPIEGTTPITLADDSERICTVATATVTVSGMSRVGVVIFEENSKEILIGMDFLRQFGLALFVSSKDILLVEEQLLPSGRRTRGRR